MGVVLVEAGAIAPAAWTQTPTSTTVLTTTMAIEKDGVRLHDRFLFFFFPEGDGVLWKKGV